MRRCSGGARVGNACFTRLEALCFSNGFLGSPLPRSTGTSWTKSYVAHVRDEAPPNNAEPGRCETTGHQPSVSSPTGCGIA
eukprot:scaffold736_cov254-Pinguiococcus_pyrenoidosus.AAC.10